MQVVFLGVGRVDVSSPSPFPFPQTCRLWGRDVDETSPPLGQSLREARPSIPVDRDGAACADLAVKLQGVVEDLDLEGFFFAVEFEIFWHSP
jgi:hypothetical protein